MRYVNTNGNVNSNNASNSGNCPRPAPAETYDTEARERSPSLKTRHI